MNARIVKNFVQGRPYGGRLLEWAHAISGLGEIFSDDFQYVEGFEARKGEGFLEQLRRQLQQDFHYTSEWLARVNRVDVSKSSLIDTAERQQDLIRFIEDVLQMRLEAFESDGEPNEMFWHVKISINTITGVNLQSRKDSLGSLRIFCPLVGHGRVFLDNHLVESELLDEGPADVAGPDAISGGQCSRVVREREVQCGDLALVKGSRYETSSDTTPSSTDDCGDCNIQFVMMVGRVDACEKVHLVSTFGMNTTDDEDEDEDNSREEVYQLPVTLLSGFSKAGKTSVLKHILKDLKGLRVAVLVNDIACIDIDAALLQDGICFVETRAKLEGLHNGHTYGNIHKDLVESVRTLALERRFDYMFIERTGISEPLNVATAFEACDDMGILLLSKLSRLDTLVTVIDCLSFLDDYHSEEKVADRSELEAEDADERLIVEVLIEQIELANVLILNKTDLVTRDQLRELEIILKKLNPCARLIKTKFGVVRPSLMMNTNSFDLDSSRMLPGWAVEMQHQGSNRKLEAEEFGISSFTYSAVKPFHPERLDRMLKDGVPLVGVLRSKGCVWSASEHQMSLQWCQAGISLDLKPWVRWLQEPRCTWPCWAEKYKKFPYGTRRQEIVFIGKNMDESEIRQSLDEVLLTDEEFALGPWQWSNWLKIAETHGDPHMDHCQPCGDSRWTTSIVGDQEQELNCGYC